LIRAQQQRRWDREAERLGGLEVDAVGCYGGVQKFALMSAREGSPNVALLARPVQQPIRMDHEVSPRSPTDKDVQDARLVLRIAAVRAHSRPDRGAEL